MANHTLIESKRYYITITFLKIIKNGLHVNFSEILLCNRCNALHDHYKFVSLICFFYVRVGFTRILKRRGAGGPQKRCPGTGEKASEAVSQERERKKSLRRGVPGKRERERERERKHQKGGPRKRGKASQRYGPGGALRKGPRPRALGQRDFT